jgi:hypothetical protein
MTQGFSKGSKTGLLQYTMNFEAKITSFCEDSMILKQNKKENAITVVISRPGCSPEFMSMSRMAWIDRKLITFFPDGRDRKSSEYPLAGITLCCKWQGHFVFASEHKEKWVLSDTQVAEIDLGNFSPEWRGCSAAFFKM